MTKCTSVASSALSTLAFTLLCFSTPAAIAHDGWIEITPAIAEKGQATTIALIQGNHSNEHRSYRIAGKWDQQFTTLTMVDPTGKQQSLTNRLVDFGDDEEKVGPKGPKGFFLASFTPIKEGLYQAVAKQTRTIQQADGPKLFTIRIAKTAFAALTIPTVSGVKNFAQFDRIIGGEDGLEIIPITNPMAVFSGSSITMELRLKGKPIEGKEVSLIRKIDGAASAQDRVSDGKGRITFTVGPADFYLARVKFDEDTPRPDGRVDKNSYESTYVFQVFNRP